MVTNTFAALRLLPVGDRDKDIEILALRHQIAVLERQLGGKKVRFTAPDRAILAALLYRLRPEVLHLWVPKTCVTWADALKSAVPCPVPGEPVSGRPDVR
jgi:putative transposase